MPGSASSTSTSTPPPPLEIKDMLEYEERRYISKGYGIVFASVMTFSFFFYGPDVGKLVFPWLKTKGTDTQLYMVMAFFFHSCMLFLLNIAMWFIYHLELPFFERYKINGRPWPWNEDQEKWKLQLKKTLKMYGFNVGIMVPFLICCDVAIGVKFRFDIESLPDAKELTWQLVLFMFVEDFVFHNTHKLLHTKKLYQIFHKIHHEYKTPIGLAAEYAHPVEFVLGNVIPVFLAPMLLGSRVHIWTIWMWTGMRTAETLDGHCGYEFSWSPYRLLPFSGKI
jgi:sterol desaturase/sphingolipid hydroxylase (fatty acid hydroxylase superfamily)